LVQQQPIKSEIDFEDWEMFEILLDAVDREDCFDEGLSGYDLGPFGYSALVPIWRVNLSDPAGITFARRADEDLGMKITEMKII
jgi:hypothetical protein